VRHAAHEEGFTVAGAPAGQGVLGNSFALVDLLPDRLAAAQDLVLLLGDLGAVPGDVGDAVAGHELSGHKLALVHRPGDVQVAVLVGAAADGAVRKVAVRGRHPASLSRGLGAALQVCRDN